MKIHDVEQGTPEWFQLRAGIPTASEFKKFYTATGKVSASLTDYAALLAAEFYAGEPLETWGGNEWTDRGKELEDEARALYELQTGHTVEQVGFCTNHSSGCSPDGLIGNDGGVEIKCLSPAKHVLAMAYVEKHNKPPTDYLSQVHGSIWVTEREWWDMWFYHPVLPSFSVRVHRDDEYLNGLADAHNTLIEKRDGFLKTIASKVR